MSEIDQSLRGMEIIRERDDWKQRALDAESAQRHIQRQFDELRVCRESVLLAQEVAQLKEDLSKVREKVKPLVDGLEILQARAHLVSNWEEDRDYWKRKLLELLDHARKEGLI